MGAVCETGRRGVCVLVLAYKEERFVWANPFRHFSPSLVSSLAFRAVVRPHLTTDNISYTPHSSQEAKEEGKRGGSNIPFMATLLGSCCLLLGPTP